jgi:hypothetical protein
MLNGSVDFLDVLNQNFIISNKVEQNRCGVKDRQLENHSA